MKAREAGLIFLFWAALATLSALNWLLDPRGGGFRMSPTGPILLGYVESGIWALLTPLIFYLTSRSSRTSIWIRIPILILLGILIAISVYALLDFTRISILDVPRRRGGAVFAPLRGIIRGRFLSHLLVYFGIVAVGFAREYFLRDRGLRGQLAEARLSALRMQINPHFLFNTLNAVSALVERDPAGARRMIARLSELLRHTLDANATDEIPLREEIAFLRRYIEIMEIRFQGRLRVDLDIAEDTLAARVPNLILQPIVENAFEHGAGRAVGEGRIAVSARREGAMLRLTVRDNGPGLASETPGVGVANTRARLEQLYGKEGRLVLTTDDGLVAEILLPFHE